MDTKATSLRLYPAFALLAAALLFSLTATAAPEIVIEQPAGTSLPASRVVGFGLNDDGQATVPAGLTGVTAIAASESHSLALKMDGTVAAWGKNNSGQTNVPAGLTGVVAISAGGSHSHALKSDGSIASWGITGPPASPPFISVAAGMAWSVAVKSDGTPVVWGQNLPVVPAGMSGLVAVAAGDYHVVGLKNDGTVVAWGNSSNNQIVVPAGLNGVVAVAAGRRHSMALKSDGTVRAWGSNFEGELNVPAGLTGVTAISAYGSHGLALKSDGSIVSWGNDFFGQRDMPPETTPARAIAGGGYHSLVLAGAPIAFGPQNPGTTSTAKTFTIKNTGADPLGITSVSLVGGNTAEFAVNTTGMLTTLPATTGQTTFSVTFSPTTVGAKKTMLRVVNTDGDEATFEVLLMGTSALPEIAVTGNGASIADGDATPSLTDHTDFGGVLVAGTTSLTRTFTVTNSASGPLTLGTVTIGGTHAADFTVAVPPAATVSAGGSTTFQIKFDPAAGGLRSATLSFANNDTDENPFDFSIQGTGLEAEISVSGNGATITDGDDTPSAADFTDFGSVNSNSGTSVRQFVIQNTGNAALTLGSVTIGGASAGDFTVHVPPPATVAAGASASFQVTFDPAAPGLRSATLSFATNDADENPFNFSIQGTGAAPEVEVTGNGVSITDGDSAPSTADATDFGSVSLPAASYQTFTIRNTGPDSLVVASFAIGGTHAGDFALVRQPPQEGYAVDPGSSTSFMIQFLPGARGLRTATVSFATNDPDENPFNFSIQGTGSSPEISVEGPGGTPLVTGAVTAWGVNNAGQTDVPPGLMGVKAVDSSANHTLALKMDGTVVAWGANGFGQTNTGDYRGIVRIAAGGTHSVYLRGDGTVFARGANTYFSQNLTIFESSGPNGRSGVAAIAAGNTRTVLLYESGVLESWAEPFDGSPYVPMPANLTGLTTIACGDKTTIALRNNGTVAAWGTPTDGQISGASALTDIAAIAGGGLHILALTTGGAVVVRGENNHDEYAGHAFTGVVAIAAGGHHDVALRSNGTIAVWGYNGSGQTTVPAGLTGVRAIAAGAAHTVVVTDSTVNFGAGVLNTPGAPQTFTVKSTGLDPLSLSGITVTGDNPGDFAVNAAGLPASLPGANGQTTFTVTFSPGGLGLRTARLHLFNDDADENSFDVMLTGSGAPNVEITVTGNGNNIVSGDTTPDTADHTDFGGAVFTGAPVTRAFTITNSGTGPLTAGTVTISGPNTGDFAVTTLPVSPVPAGGSTTFEITFTPAGTDPALRTATVSFSNDDLDESLFSFSIQGRSIVPEIAIGETSGVELHTVTAPVIVWGRAQALGMLVPAELAGVLQVATSGFHCTVLKSDGTVVAWGDNSQGQLNIPAGLNNNITKIAAGSGHTLALKNDGTVVAWGANDYGQATVPDGLSGVSAVATGSIHSVVLKTDGTVAAWGFSQAGPDGLTGITAIAAGGSHTVALKADGTVVAWGLNGFGQTDIPPGLAGVTAIAAGGSHSLALKADGTVVAWGRNTDGETTVPPGLSNVIAIFAGDASTAAVRADGTVVVWGRNDWGQTIVPGGLPPVTAIATGITTLALVKNTLDFAPQFPGVSGPAKTITVKNTGSDPLSLTSVSITGANASDFALNTTGMPATVPAGGQTTFTITFTPSAADPRTAKLRILSNDADEGNFEYVLAGRGLPPLTPLEAWRQLHFGTTASAGDAADDADPDHDGWRNLFEYHAGLIPTDPQSVFHFRQESDPAHPNECRIIFSPVSPDTDYTVQSSTTMAPGSWEPVTGATLTDSGGERTVTDTGAADLRKFYRVRLQRP